MTIQVIKEYWEKATPMGFATEKWTYEQKRAFRYGLQDYMHEAFGFEKFAGKKVLEVGCGSGLDAVEFAKSGAIVTAMDITDNSIALTRALAEEAGVKITVVQAPAGSIPYKDNTFECVYCFGVLHHIPDGEEALQEMHRILKEGGQIMAMLYNRDSLLYAYSIMYLHGVREGQLKGWTEEGLVARYSERIEGCPFTRAYTKHNAVALFEGAGFRDVTISVHYNVIDHPQQRKVKLGLDDKWELGWHLVVKGIK